MKQPVPHEHEVQLPMLLPEYAEESRGLGAWDLAHALGACMPLPGRERSVCARLRHKWLTIAGQLR